MQPAVTVARPQFPSHGHNSMIAYNNTQPTRCHLGRDENSSLPLTQSNRFWKDWKHVCWQDCDDFHILRYFNFHLTDCKQRVTQYVVPSVTHTGTKETKPVVVGQVQGYVISSIIFYDTEMILPLPYCFLRYQSHTYKPAGLKGAVIVTNVTRESGMPHLCIL